MSWAQTNIVAPTRRLGTCLGGALAAQRAVLDRPWIGVVPCTKRRRMELILGQHEPLEQSRATVSTYRDQDVLLCPRLAASAVPLLSPVPQGPLRRDWAGARGDRRVAGRVRARVNSKNFTLTELTCWADGL